MIQQFLNPKCLSRINHIKGYWKHKIWDNIHHLSNQVKSLTNCNTLAEKFSSLLAIKDENVNPYENFTLILAVKVFINKELSQAKLII